MTDPDLTEFYKLSRPRKRPCQVAFAMTQLKPAERAQYEAANATDQGIITNAALQGWLAVRKHEINIPTIVSHRKRTCSCADA